MVPDYDPLYFICMWPRLRYSDVITITEMPCTWYISTIFSRGSDYLDLMALYIYIYIKYDTVDNVIMVLAFSNINEEND